MRLPVISKLLKYMGAQQSLSYVIPVALDIERLFILEMAPSFGFLIVFFPICSLPLVAIQVH